MELITVLPFQKHASPILAQRKPNGKLRLLLELKKINSLIAIDYTSSNHPIKTLSDATQHLAGKALIFKVDCLRLIRVCRRWTNGQWKCLHSIFLAELLPTKDLRRVSADLCLLFQVSCASTWIQLSKLTNVLNKWTTLESQSKMLRTLPGTFGQSSIVIAEQNWNSQSRSAIWETDRLISSGERFH